MMLRATFLGLLLAIFGTSCVVVNPWQRERMGTLVMTRGADIEEAIVERTFLESREAASGGSAGGKGGGCACN